MRRASGLLVGGNRRQFKGAEMKFIGVGLSGHLDQRKFGMRKLPPDREIGRGHGEPPEPEHIPARFGHLSGSLPTKLGDHGSLRLSEWT
jgi:hypothetical protein